MEQKVGQDFELPQNASDNVAQEDRGSGKDCEPERKSSTTAEQNHLVPDHVEKHQGDHQKAGSEPNNVAEKRVMEKFPPTELTNDHKDGNSKTDSSKAGESKNAVTKKTGDEDEKGMISKRASSEFRNAVMEDSMNEEERVSGILDFLGLWRRAVKVDHRRITDVL